MNIMARSTANTRMRDFYDIYVITEKSPIDKEILRQAFLATSARRNTAGYISDFRDILHGVETDPTMMRMWNNYRVATFFVGDLSWTQVMKKVKALAEIVL